VGKRVAIISVVLLLIGLAILGYYLQQGRKRLLADPYKAISPSACMVIETTDLQTFLNSLTTKKGLFGEVARVMEFFPTRLPNRFIKMHLKEVHLCFLFIRAGRDG
jgi:hypothetical protein